MTTLNAVLGDPIGVTNFWLVLRKPGGVPAELTTSTDPLVYATLVPRDDQFFAGPQKDPISHTLSEIGVKYYRLDPKTRKFVPESSTTVTVAAA